MIASNAFTPAIPLTHPFANDTHIRPDNIRDTLDNCVSTLHMVSEFFVDERTDPFDFIQVRRGAYLQLQSVASVLESINKCLYSESRKAVEEWEAEQQADREARRAVEQRIESDPAVIEKSVILAKAFGQAYREVLGKDGKEGAQ